jgi:hypothetical protein
MYRGEKIVYEKSEYEDVRKVAKALAQFTPLPVIVPQGEASAAN